MPTPNKQTIELSYHRPNWIFEYTEEVKKMMKLIPSSIKVCYIHVGSTAAHYVTARPIIDIAVGVINPLDLITVKNILAIKGYKFIENKSTIYDLLLEKKDEGKSTFNIHVVEFEGKKWNDMFKFTQFIKSSPEAAKEYSDFKIDLLLKKKVSPIEYERQKSIYIEKQMQKLK